MPPWEPQDTCSCHNFKSRGGVGSRCGCLLLSGWHLGTHEDGECWGHLQDVAVTGGGFAGFAAAMLGALWAYDGWNNISCMAGEVKHPERNLPLALIASMLIIITLYVIVNVSYYYVMNPTDVASISATSSVSAESIGRVLGPVAVTLMAGVMMLSSWGSLQTSILGTARIPYAMARDGVSFKAWLVFRRTRRCR